MSDTSLIKCDTQKQLFFFFTNIFSKDLTNSPVSENSDYYFLCWASQC